MFNILYMSSIQFPEVMSVSLWPLEALEPVVTTHCIFEAFCTNLFGNIMFFPFFGQLKVICSFTNLFLNLGSASDKPDFEKHSEHH